VRAGGDVGEPVIVTDPDSPVAHGLSGLAERVAQQGPSRVYRQELKLV
jgi:hypothetical protein